LAAPKQASIAIGLLLRFIAGVLMIFSSVILFAYLVGAN